MSEALLPYIVFGKPFQRVIVINRESLPFRGLFGLGCLEHEPVIVAPFVLITLSVVFPDSFDLNFCKI